MDSPTFAQRAGIAAAVVAVAGTVAYWRATTGGPPPAPLYARDGGYVAVGWPDGGSAPPGTVCMEVTGCADEAAVALFYDSAVAAQSVLVRVCDPPIDDAGTVATPPGMYALTNTTGKVIPYQPGIPRFQAWLDSDAPYECACNSGESLDGGAPCTIEAPDGGRVEAPLGLVLKPEQNWQGAGCRHKACDVCAGTRWPTERCPLGP